MDNLENKSLEEIRAIADKLNIKYHHLAKAETIIAQINQQGVARIDDAMQHPAEKPVETLVKFNTQQEVIDAVQMYLNKGVTADFDDVDQTVTFRYNGREECINLSTPLRVIRQKAENVSKGRLSPKGFKDGKDIVLWA